MKKLLIATGNRELDDAIAAHIKAKYENEYLLDFTSYREGVMHKISAFNPDTIVLSEMLSGNIDLLELAFDIKKHFAGIRVVFLTGADRKGELPLLVAHNIYDFLASNAWTLDSILELIEYPKQFADVQMYLPNYSTNRQKYSYIGETTKNDDVNEENETTQRGIEVSSEELTDLTKELSSTRINHGFNASGRERVLFEQGEKIGSFPTLVKPANSIIKSSRPKRIQDRPKETIPMPTFEFNSTPYKKSEEIKIELPKLEEVKQEPVRITEPKEEVVEIDDEEEIVDGTYTDGAIEEETLLNEIPVDEEVIEDDDEELIPEEPKEEQPKETVEEEVVDEEEEIEEEEPVIKESTEAEKMAELREQLSKNQFGFPTINTIKQEPKIEKIVEQPKEEEVKEDDMFTCDMSDFTPKQKDKKNKKQEPAKKTDEKPKQPEKEKTVVKEITTEVKAEPQVKDEVNVFTMKPAYKNYLFMNNIVSGSQTAINLAYMLAMNGKKVLYIVHSKYSLMKSISGESNENCKWSDSLKKLPFKLPKKAQVKGQVELYNYTGKRINEILDKIPFKAYDHIVMELDCSRYENGHLKEIYCICEGNKGAKVYVPISQDYVFMEFIANDRLMKFNNIEYTFMIEKFMLEGLSSNRITKQFGKPCIKIYDDVVKCGNTYNNKALMIGKEKFEDAKAAYKDLLKDIIEKEEEGTD